VRKENARRRAAFHCRHAPTAPHFFANVMAGFTPAVTF